MTIAAHRQHTRERHLTVQEVAEWLNLSPRTVYRLLADGQLVGLKIRSCLRIPETSVLDYLDRQKSLFLLEFGTEDDRD